MRDEKGQPRTLVDIYGLNEGNHALAVSNAVKRLKAGLQTGTLRRAGLVRFTVVAPGDTLVRDVADTILKAVDEFDQRVRRTTAAAERVFVETRLSVLREETRMSEDTLERWLETNRAYTSYPALMLEFQRLSRHISEHSAMYNTLVLNYEQTRVDEARNTPVLMSVQPARVPVRGQSRGTLVWAMLAVILVSLAEVLRRFVVAPVDVSDWSLVRVQALERAADMKRTLRIRTRQAIKA